jgi:hypothetical protein
MTRAPSALMSALMPALMSALMAAFALAALALVLAGPAGASEANRYVLKDVEGGFIRLDSESGAVSHCRSLDGHWRCEPVADARDALQDEIGRLAEENAALKQRLSELEAGLQSEPDSGSRLELPSEQDIDRIFGVFERFMRRFFEFARSLNEDPGRET